MNCPDCKIPMDLKEGGFDDYQAGEYLYWKCPRCRVEIDFTDEIYEEASDDRG